MALARGVRLHDRLRTLLVHFIGEELELAATRQGRTLPGLNAGGEPIRLAEYQLRE
jgi:hypothetical protein